MAAVPPVQIPPTDLTPIIGTPPKVFAWQNKTQGTSGSGGPIRASVGDQIQVNTPSPMPTGLAVTATGPQGQIPIAVGPSAVSTLVGVFSTTLPGAVDFTAPGFATFTVNFS